MEEFTIYCTVEQTRRAFKLNAPIKHYSPYTTGPGTNICLVKDLYEWDNADITCDDRLIIPTAEQMKNWLKRVHKISIHLYEWDFWEYDMSYNGQCYDGVFYKTEEEALLAAIDVALDILEDEKNKTTPKEDISHE